MSEVLWTCAGCGVAATVEGPLEMLAGKSSEVRWEHEDGTAYRHGESSEKPPFEIDEKPYCSGCAQSCGNCDLPIFKRSELEAGDSYAAGSAFLPAGKYLQGDALCVDCFSECCEECGASPTEECTCNPEDNEHQQP